MPCALICGSRAGPCRGRFTHSFRCPRHAPRRAGALAVRAVCRRGRRRRPFVRSARRSVRRHRPLFQIAWLHRCRIIGLGQLAACLAPRLYGSLALSRSCVPRDPDASTVDRARSAMRRRLRVTLALYTPCVEAKRFSFYSPRRMIRTTVDAVLHPPYAGLLLIGVMMIATTNGLTLSRSA